MRPYTVQAEWDSQAAVWIGTSDDVPGLCAEAATLEQLTDIVLELVPELLVANGVIGASDPDEIPVHITAQRSAVAHRAA